MIKSSHPGIGVVILSQHANAVYAERLLRDGAGGRAYLLKERVSDVEALLRALEEVASGGSVIVTSQILRSILEAKVVIADLTGRNPNVFYEVAFAQSFGKAIVMLIDDPDTLPFDTRNERTIPLGGREGPIGFEEGVAAQDRLRDSLTIVLAAEYVPTSLITDLAGVRSLADLAPENPIATELASVKDTVEEIRALVRRTGRSENTQGDIRTFTKLIDELIAGGRLFRDDLEKLASAKTASTGLRSWAQGLTETMPPKDVDPDEIPF